MGKIITVTAVVVVALLAWSLAEVQTVKTQTTPDGKGCPLLSNINIISPSNTTYDTKLPTLNVTVKSLFSPSQYRFVMVYSIDGKSNVTIPLTTTFTPLEVEIIYPNGTTGTRISIFSPYITNGETPLPELPEGQHELTVYANYERTSTNHNYPALILDSSTIYFTTDNKQPTVISNPTLENKTYNQNHTAENETSETVTFTVDTTKPFPATLIATASTVSVTAAVSIGLLPYFKKHKH